MVLCCTCIPVKLTQSSLPWACPRVPAVSVSPVGELTVHSAHRPHYRRDTSSFFITGRSFLQMPLFNLRRG